MGRARFRAAVALSVAGFLISCALTYLHLGAVADPQGYKSFCNISPGVNCDAVALSKYAVVLGVPNSVYGALFYVLVGVLSVVGLPAPRESGVRMAGHLFVFVSGALLYSFYLGGISYLRLKTVCILCSALYGVNLALFLVIGSLAHGSPVRLARNLLGDSIAVVRARTAVVAAAVPVSLAIIVLFAVLDVRARELAAERFLSEYVGLPRLVMPPTGGVAFGPENAPVTIVEFFDYRCPSCKEVRAGLQRLLHTYPAQIRLELTDYPQCYDCLESNDPRKLPVPCILPLVARYAHTEGKWWDASAALFENAGRLESWEAVLQLAAETGVDTTGFTEAVVGGALLSKLRTDVVKARWLGIDEVPTFVVNGRVLPVVPSRRMLDAIIEYELSQPTELREEQGGGGAP